MEAEKAVYSNASIEEFIGNPLIEALPDLGDPVEYPKYLMIIPPYKETDRELPGNTRLSLLQRMSQLHIPTSKDIDILHRLTRCLTWGYVSRNPMNLKEVEEVYARRGLQMTESLKKYLKTTTAPIYGFPVLGISGTGKTTSVQNVLSLYPQVIQHTEYNGKPFEATQLVWLKADCPGDGTPKGLCSAILSQIDSVLGTDWTGQILRNRMSKDVLLIKVSNLVQRLHLGILIIDDIQNLCGRKGSVSAELLSFMISMANTLKIPVLMVGTPKILSLLQREFQQAKRASGEGEVHMSLMEKDSREWKRFIRILWQFQYTRKTVELTEEMAAAFFEESVGNPFIAATLYKVVQDDAIIGRTEAFSISDIHHTASQKMGITAQMRNNMLNGVDEELNQYRSLWTAAHADAMETEDNPMGKSSNSEQDVITQVSAKLLAIPNMTIQKARKLARAAQASHLNEKNIDVLYGTALDLWNTKEDA